MLHEVTNSERSKDRNNGLDKASSYSEAHRIAGARVRVKAKMESSNKAKLGTAVEPKTIRKDIIRKDIIRKPNTKITTTTILEKETTTATTTTNTVVIATIMVTAIGSTVTKRSTATDTGTITSGVTIDAIPFAATGRFAGTTPGGAVTTQPVVTGGTSTAAVATTSIQASVRFVNGITTRFTNKA